MTAPPGTHNQIRAWLSRHGLFAVLCVAAAAVLLAAYSNHFDNQFHFDDYHTIRNNLYIRDLGNTIRFFTDSATHSNAPENAAYRPLVTLHSAIDYRVGGGLNPRQFHRSQFGLLLLLAGLLVYLYKRLADLGRPSPANRYLALFSATFFSIHTANTETLNYLYCRTTLLSTLFVVIGFVLYLAWPAGRRSYLYLLPMLIGTFAKPLAIMFAPLLLVFVLFFEEQLSPEELGSRIGWNKVLSALRRLWPALALAGVLLAFVKMMDGSSVRLVTSDRWEYLMTQPFVWLHYLRLFLFPVGLTADTDMRLLQHPYDTRLFAGLLWIAALGLGIYALGRRAALRPAAFGLAWFAIALLPTSSVFPLGVIYNEHRVFFPYVGLTFAAVWLGAALLFGPRSSPGRDPGRLVGVGTTLALLVLIAHGIGTYQRNRVWATDETIWADVTQKSPLNGRGQMAYGLVLMHGGDYPGAISKFERAQSILPTYPLVKINLGIAHASMGQAAIAEGYFRRALEMDPRSHRGMFAYARSLIGMSRTPEALELLKQSLEISPATPFSRTLLTRVLATLGNDAALRAVVAQTLQIDPSDPTALAYSRGALPFGPDVRTEDAYRELGLEKLTAGSWLDAAASYRRLFGLAPGTAEDWNNLGWALAKLGFRDRAAECFRSASALDPNLRIAQANLNWLLNEFQPGPAEPGVSIEAPGLPSATGPGSN